MGTTTAEPQAVPEKKMRRADDAFSVENEEDPTSATTATSRELGDSLEKLKVSLEGKKPMSKLCGKKWDLRV